MKTLEERLEEIFKKYDEWDEDEGMDPSSWCWMDSYPFCLSVGWGALRGKTKKCWEEIDKEIKEAGIEAITSNSLYIRNTWKYYENILTQ